MPDAQPEISEPEENVPRSLYGIQAGASEFQRQGYFPPHIQLLGALVADLAWHIMEIKDRLNDAEIPQLEERDWNRTKNA